MSTSKSNTYLEAEVLSFKNIKIKTALHVNLILEQDSLVLWRPSAVDIWKKNEKQLLPPAVELSNNFGCCFIWNLAVACHLWIRAMKRKIKYGIYLKCLWFPSTLQSFYLKYMLLCSKIHTSRQALNNDKARLFVTRVLEAKTWKVKLSMVLLYRFKYRGFYTKDGTLTAWLLLHKSQERARSSCRNWECFTKTNMMNMLYSNYYCQFFYLWSICKFLIFAISDFLYSIFHFLELYLSLLLNGLHIFRSIKPFHLVQKPHNFCKMVNIKRRKQKQNFYVEVLCDSMNIAAFITFL